IGPPSGGKFIDALCGTGAVAQAASRAGWPVHVNDHLTSAAITSFARMLSYEQVGFESLGGYSGAVKLLNNSKPKKGFIWKEYSPASIAHCAVSRMYFTEENAAKIDGIRNTIAEWTKEGLVNSDEEKLLIADLLGATNRIANTAGTYGCFLSKWQPQSMEPIILKPREVPQSSPMATMSTKDVLDVRCSPEDSVYLDPPYTKRQYAAYYHILETIALGDNPIVEGVCGIRPWQHLASDYCYKVRAAKALQRLVKDIPAQQIYLSYSNEGHVPLEQLDEILSGIG